MVGPVDPEGAFEVAASGDFALEWSAERLSARLRKELTPVAWHRLVRLAACCGTSVEQLLRSKLSVVAGTPTSKVR